MGCGCGGSTQVPVPPGQVTVAGSGAPDNAYYWNGPKLKPEPPAAAPAAPPASE